MGILSLFLMLLVSQCDMGGDYTGNGYQGAWIFEMLETLCGHIVCGHCDTLLMAQW